MNKARAASPAQKRPATKRPAKQRPAKASPAQGDPISAYASAQPPAFGQMCAVLRGLIDAALPKAESKVWHGSPVWFLDDNPVVGYSTTKKSVNLLFWNGQALDEPELKPVGKYRAAQAVFATADEIDPIVVRRWLKNAGANVFDSRAFFKKLREGK